MNCLVCAKEASLLMQGEILHKHTISYFTCPTCGCIFTEEPYWLDEAYQESISSLDTGIMVRNITICEQLMILFTSNFNPNISVVDYGGGYGILTRLLRDKGVNAFWSDKFCENLIAKGFEYNGKDPVDVMLAFEVLEHLPNPLETIQEIMSKTNCFIFSTELLEKTNYSSNKDWWYFMPDAGQHVFFSSKTSMLKIAEKLKCSYLYYNGLHILYKPEYISIKRPSAIKRMALRIIGKINNIIKSDASFQSKTWLDHLTMLKEIK
jgi:hypothetical protein